MDRSKTRKLRALNERVWAGECDLFPVNSSLDSALKKNTAFIKRLRTAISSATLNTFLQEIRTLSLHKYLSEIVPACYEGLCRLKSLAEIEAGVEVVSALHQRFGPAEFTKPLGWLLGKGLSTPDKSFLKTLPAETHEREEKDRLARQRVLLRVVTELWLVQVLRTLDDVSRPDDTTKGATGKAPEIKSRAASKGGAAEPFPLEALKDILGHDREHINLPLLVTFFKTFSWEVFGIAPAAAPPAAIEGSKLTTDGDDVSHGTGTSYDGAAAATAPDATSLRDARNYRTSPPAADKDQGSFFTTPELQEKFRDVLRRYFDDVKAHLIRDQKAIFAQSRRNAEAYVKSGEIFEDRQSNFEKQVKTQERLVSNAQVIADAIGAAMPDLKNHDDPNASANGSIGLVKTREYLRGQGVGPGIWDDEEERRFYENLVDLKGKVPDILLVGDARKKKSDGDEALAAAKKKADPVDPSDSSSSKSTDAPTIAVGVEEEEPNPSAATIPGTKTIGAQVDALLLRLPEFVHKDAIDQFAIDFCFVNSKASRNRLVKSLTEVPKGRSDLLPFWSRLIATLGRYMPDIPKAVVGHLDAEFRSLQRRKEKDFLGQVRLGNIRYLAELTKFAMVPEHVVFHCLKVALDDFSRMNIDIICNMLENCGRYLFRNPETSERMTSFLETLQRKKAVQHVGQTERMLLKNAVYYVDPPQQPAIAPKQRTPMELFVRKLVYEDMSKTNLSRVIRHIRRLHWEEKEVVAILRKVFSKPARVKFGHISLLATALSTLYRFHAGFVIDVVDSLIESIKLGLEQNDFRHNQRRIAEVRYLGELYNYRLLDHPVIFDTMLLIMLHGHRGHPHLLVFNPLDIPDDYFRIHLIAAILETCGVFFHQGTAARKLDFFLSYFQYYISTKNPLPIEVEFIVHDIYALTRPQWELATNFDEAAKTFQAAIAQYQRNPTGPDKTAEPSPSTPSGSSSDDENGDADADSGSDEEPKIEENEDYHSDQDDDGYDEDEAIVVTREKQQDVDPEFDADFDREFAKMMSESLESRKFERKQQFDLALPLRAKNRDMAPTPCEPRDDGPETMAFALLTKKGNRQQTRTVELPSDSNLAIALRHQQQADREEQQRIKNLVLNYDLRESDALESEDSARAPHPHGHSSAHTAPKAGHDKPASASFHHNRPDHRSGGKERASQRVRKLQMSDVNW